MITRFAVVTEGGIRLAGMYPKNSTIPYSNNGIRPGLTVSDHNSGNMVFNSLFNTSECTVVNQEHFKKHTHEAQSRARLYRLICRFFFFFFAPLFSLTIDHLAEITIPFLLA